MNANTHYLDLSVVYGSDDKTAEELRTKENGKLKISPLKNHHEKLLLPPGPEPLGRPCSLAREVSGVEPADDIKCFNAGETIATITVLSRLFLIKRNPCCFTKVTVDQA
jgi:peroxidase